MFRLILLVLLFCPPIVHAGELTFQFIGNMAFWITDGQTSLYSDFPYESGAFGYHKYDPKFLRDDPDAISLITHVHRDHWQPELFAKTNWKVIGPLAAREAGDKTRAIAFDKKIQYKGITIEPIATPHANLEHYSYLVTWEGFRLYFTGDTESADQLLKIKNLDVAFVSPWLIAEVSSKGQKIDTKKLVVYHHTEDEKIKTKLDHLRPEVGESFVVKAN